MAYDSTRYERAYRTLIALYPHRFRERVGESMVQTFNDLCRERRDAGESLFAFVAWTYVDTIRGIIKANIKDMRLQSKMKVLMTIAMLACLGILYFVWWTNGKDDTWLYVTSALIVLSSITPTLFKKNEDIK